MTDKQIIIDMVDVKDCIAYAKSQTVYLGNTLYNQAENICMVKNQPCKFFDCQFKQMARELKRKEQECEELKKEQAEIKKYLGISHKTILERLKELTEFRDRDRDEMFQLEKQLDQLKAEVKSKTEYIQEQREIIDQYSKEIEKIKEIVKKGVKIHDDIIVNKQILQICDEAINE